MPSHIPRRLRHQIDKQGWKKQHTNIRLHVEGGGAAVFGDASTISTTTVNSSGERATLADDVMPATLTTLPILVVILLLALTDQTILLRSIVQEGNPLGLAVQFMPLFSPTIVASLVYFAKARGWLRLSAGWTNLLALVPAGLLGLFVPLNYLGLQLVVFGVSLTWLRVRHRRPRWRIVVLALVITGSLAGLGAVAEWRWRRIDHFPRVAVGRIVDGLTRMNVDDRPQSRSVLVISVNDAYALVASQSYPPTVEAIPVETLQKGRVCQLKPRWNQVSLIRHLTGGADELANSVEVCMNQ
ncbi:hypothetical protein O7627_11845 [Solwaraspora sp. WMMD1047]|uniref:hypothetical protein n=1 Tax=Solwaraspora sp. WMMD1047 TaxID=3016102 RepID=UPI002417BB6D|nr:hypothetical protein [Solwaraspora sp. WMMD1047]MDG4829991.1 hypothetical protein [Solwaraspora sp. WMMD1047]